jgi:hypothetical protein
MEKTTEEYVNENLRKGQMESSKNYTYKVRKKVGKH